MARCIDAEVAVGVPQHPLVENSSHHLQLRAVDDIRDTVAAAAGRGTIQTPMTAAMTAIADTGIIRFHGKTIDELREIKVFRY